MASVAITAANAAKRNAVARRWASGDASGFHQVLLPKRDVERMGKFLLATDCPADLREVVGVAVELYLDTHFGKEGEKLPAAAQKRLREVLAPPEPPTPAAVEQPAPAPARGADPVQTQILVQIAALARKIEALESACK